MSKSWFQAARIQWRRRHLNSVGNELSCPLNFSEIGPRKRSSFNLRLIFQTCILPRLVACSSWPIVTSGWASGAPHNNLTLRLDDSSSLLVAEFLQPFEVIALKQVARYQRNLINHHLSSILRTSPWSVEVRIRDRRLWLDPGQDKDWDHVEEILHVHPSCLMQRPPSAKGLLDRLPLKL